MYDTLVRRRFMNGKCIAAESLASSTVEEARKLEIVGLWLFTPIPPRNILSSSVAK
jgi:hypothetical protein